MTSDQHPMAPPAVPAPSPVRPAADLSAGPVAWKRWFFPGLVLVLTLDQITKYWLFSLPSDAELPGWIETSWNTGVAWGLMGRYPSLVMLLTLLLIPILGWVWWRWFRPVGRWENLAFGLILGGALGNGWDRLLTRLGAGPQFRGVRDFIRVDLGPIGIDYVWPNFNVADAAICSGFFLLVLLSLRPTATPSPPQGEVG